MDSKYIAVDDMSTAGSAVWWRLSGSLSLERLTEVWQDAGLDSALLPNPPTAITALARAAKTQAGPHTLVRSLGQGKWAVVNEHARDEELEYAVEARLSIDKVGRLVLKPHDHPQAEELRASYETHLNELISADVSPWFSKLMTAVHAVSLRDTGGVYFVPRTHLEEWRQMARAIQCASSHTILGMPCMRTDEAIHAIIDAVTQEAQSETIALEAELASDTLGGRALESRVHKADEVKSKVTSYESLLGKKLDNLHDALDAVRAKLARARLRAEGTQTTETFGRGRLEATDLG